jgi:hypothetical protein
MMLDIDEEHLSQEEEKSPHYAVQPQHTIIGAELLTAE